MTPEERFERIERVLDRNDEQIARHSEQLDKQFKLSAQNDAQIARHSEQIARHSEQLDKQLKLTAEHDAQIARHSEQLDKHPKLIAENSGPMAELRGLVLPLARLSEARGPRSSC